MKKDREYITTLIVASAEEIAQILTEGKDVVVKNTKDGIAAFETSSKRRLNLEKNTLIADASVRR